MFARLSILNIAVFRKRALFIISLFCPKKICDFGYLFSPNDGKHDAREFGHGPDGTLLLHFQVQLHFNAGLQSDA
jgi:hypothetical protein